MAADDKNVRMDGKAHRAFARLSLKLDEQIKVILSVAASNRAIMKAIEAAVRKAKK